MERGWGKGNGRGAYVCILNLYIRVDTVYFSYKMTNKRQLYVKKKHN